MHESAKSRKTAKNTDGCIWPFYHPSGQDFFPRRGIQLQTEKRLDWEMIGMETEETALCPQTDRLYYDNAYLTEFEARVVNARPDGWIALDRSAFYPTSGGQPFDAGALERAGQTVRVSDVQVENGVVWHKTDGAFAVGDAVRGTIDWPRRWDHMQQHAGDHMLAGAAWQMFGAVTIGLHLGAEDSTIDLTFPDGRTHLAEDEISALEDVVNLRVQMDDPIRCWFPAPEELSGLPMRKRPTVSEHVRVVAMGDYEMVPCGGTHPASTGQIGPVKILSASPARGKLRLCFLAGMRAIRYFQRTAKTAETVAAALSAKIQDAPDALQKERDARAAERKEMSQRLLTAALSALEAAEQNGVYCAHLAFADRDTLLRAAGELTKDPKAAALLSCPGGAGRLLIFARGRDCPVDMAALLRASGARGGGRPDMAQGSAEDGAPLLAALEKIRAENPA